MIIKILGIALCIAIVVILIYDVRNVANRKD